MRTTRTCLLLAALLATAACRRRFERRVARGHGNAQQAPPPSEPVAALYDRSPLEGPGDVPPIVVVYGDGRVIRRVGDGAAARLIEGRVAPDVVQGLVRDHADLAQVARSTDCPEVSDGASVDIVLRVGDRLEGRHAYGVMLDDPADAGCTAPPPAFARVWRRLLALRVADERPWLPDAIELALRPLPSENSGTPWPPELPAPPTAPASQDGGVASVVVDGRHRARAIEFLRSAAWTGALLDGRRWSLEVRDLVPGHALLNEARERR